MTLRFSFTERVLQRPCHVASTAVLDIAGGYTAALEIAVALTSFVHPRRIQVPFMEFINKIVMCCFSCFSATINVLYSPHATPLVPQRRDLVVMTGTLEGMPCHYRDRDSCQKVRAASELEQKMVESS